MATDSQGVDVDLMDTVGKNCFICARMDYLPFTCPDCSKVLW